MVIIIIFYYCCYYYYYEGIKRITNILCEKCFRICFSTFSKSLKQFEFITPVGY